MSPVLGVLLLILIISAAATMSYLVSVGSNQSEPVPNVVATAEDFDADEQRVTIYHDRGETVSVEKLELAVKMDHEVSRLVNLPVNSSVNSSNIESNDVFDWSESGVGGVLDSSTSNSWSASNSIEFRIDEEKLDLEPGDEVIILVIHQPSGMVLFERTLTAK